MCEIPAYLIQLVISVGIDFFGEALNAGLEFGDDLEVVRLPVSRLIVSYFLG